jgi:hypothetical protein
VVGQRASIPLELRKLIRRMPIENPTWGEERIANELLLKLRLRVSPRTVRKYMPIWPPGGPRGDQRWSTFLKNHAHAIVACDWGKENHTTIMPQHGMAKSSLKPWIEFLRRTGDWHAPRYEFDDLARSHRQPAKQSFGDVCTKTPVFLSLWQFGRRIDRVTNS